LPEHAPEELPTLADGLCSTVRHLPDASRLVVGLIEGRNKVMRNICGNLWVRACAALSLLILVFAGSALAQSGTSSNETIPSGSLIIPMDNSKQGNNAGLPGSDCAGPAFNLKAYGLAVRLLNNNIPLKWAIANKATKDAVDFTVNATRSFGQSCNDGPASRDFSGGPLIISQEYVALATPFINTFNGEISGDANDVRVYTANAQFTAPIRYTLTHKPLIAVGPVNGGWGGDPHTTLFNEAKLQGYYAQVNDSTIGTGSCYTMATQAHATSAPFFNSFKNFVENGGNFLIQCESITHYEQNQSPRFQSSLGFNLFGNSSQFPGRTGGTASTTIVYPNPAMPFNQFVGEFASNVDGAVSEYSLVGGDGNFINGGLSAVRNNSSGWDTTHVAAVSRIPTTTGGGGHIFTLGGHDYYRDTTPTDANLERRNSQRMILNAVLIPSRRPACTLEIPLVKAFKSVRISTNTGPVTLTPGDTVEWTIQFINSGLAPVTNFQISDVIETPDLSFVSFNISALNGGATAVANGSYNGTGNNNMLNAGAILPEGGRIEIKLRTLVNNVGIHLNQATGTGFGMPDGGVRTDTHDNTLNNQTVGGYTISCPTTCLNQAPWHEAADDSDPTGISLLAPSSAPANIAGRVQDTNGTAIGRIPLTLTRVSDGTTWQSLSNTFGYFSFEGIPSGQVYIVSVNSKRHSFPVDTQTITLNDDISDLIFTAEAPTSFGGKSLLTKVNKK
jgi:conserved repeat domain